MGKHTETHTRMLNKLDEILNKMDRDAKGLDDEINETARHLESLLVEKCERDGIASIAVNTGPLHFVAGPDA
jgi:hypothetical protein